MPICVIIDGKATRVFTDSTGSTPGNTPVTYTGRAIGTAAADRVVVVVVMYQAVGPVGSCTIQGITASKFGGVANVTSLVEFWAAAVPTGTTADITLGAGTGTNPRIGIAVYALYGTNGITPYVTASDTTSTYDAALANVTGGSVVISGILNASTTTETWTNVTEDVDAIQTNVNYSAGSTETTVFSSTLTVTATPSGGATAALSAAVWGP